MTSILQDRYPGDRSVELLLIVALGVALLSAVAWVIAKGLPKRPAGRHLVLISALCGCLAMPALALAFGASGFALFSIPLMPAGPEPSRPTAVGMMQLPATGRLAIPVDRWVMPDVTQHIGENRPRTESRTMVSPIAPPRVLVSRPSAISRPGRSSPARTIATLALIAWGCGSLLFLIRFARSWRLVDRLRRGSVLINDTSLLSLVDEVGRALGMHRLPTVLTSQDAPTPLAFGCLRPTIIVPAGLIGAIGDGEMRDVLLHEMAHLRRRDPLIVLLQELARALYWPIVPVHAMIRELGRAREELCDNHVLQGRDALSYGETLLHLAELSCNAPSLVAAVGIVEWKGDLERRIAGLLAPGRSTMTRTNRGLVCLVALLFVAGGTIASATRLSAGGKQVEESAQKAEKDAKTKPEANPKAEEKPKRSILIHTLGPDGKPMPGVEVQRSVWTRKHIKDYNRRLTSDASGEVRFDIPEGTYIYRIWARTKGHVPLYASWEEEDNPETSMPAEFTFRLSPGTIIGGVVRNTDGQPIKGVTVEVKLERGGRGTGRTRPDGWLAEQGPTTSKTYTGSAPITDDQGRWTLDNVPPGGDLELKLKLTHPDYISDANWGEMQEKQGVDLKALRVRKATITMRGGIVATGTITDPQGKPVAGAVVVRGDRPYWEEGSQEVRTDEQGRYRLPPLSSGKQTLTVVAQDWMPAQTKIDIKQGMAPVDFRLRTGKDLRIRVIDQDGKPIPGVDVWIDNWRAGESLYNFKHPNVLDTKIPDKTDGDGIYRWTWAPDDAVAYRFSKEGYVELELDLTASASEQTVTLPKILRIMGKVTDTNGRPIKGVTAVPVVEFRPGNLLAARNDAKGPSDGAYAIEVDRTDVAYRVRVEAPGYRTAMSESSVRAGAVNPTFDFKLDPAPAVEGRILDAGGRPIKDARVYLATHSQNLNGWQDEDRGSWSSDQKVLTDDRGRFMFPAQFEQAVIVAVHDRGYAEIRLEPGQQPGDLTLGAWAQIEGRLVQAGEPIPAAWVVFEPIRINNDVLPHIQDQTSVKTDRNGRFVFPRVPPVKSHVSAQISVWQDGPLRSSRSVPLDLKPGEKVKLDLGGEGTQVTGRVVLSGDAASKIDLHKSLNWLIRRAPGIEPPPDLRVGGLSAQNGWSIIWKIPTREGYALIDTLHNHFVMLEPDGRFQISGVPAGDYDLALRLYEPPGDGCLVTPVGSRIVTIHITEEGARQAAFDLGEIPVKVAAGSHIGDIAPDFTTTTSTGEAVTLSSLRGRHVLLDFWATWCGPCIANLPELQRFHETFAKDNRVTVVGLNLDDDRAAAQSFLDARKLPWTQAFLGGQGGDKDDVLSRYSISSVPTYILIGPDGKLIHRGNSLEEIVEILRRPPR
jgi:beta-lactamase regulating signal transducer with metallopeptidase domain/protocatechuate 3,4-dioxygenase beta subunit/thiol-disulfide isomerase/thioredoxin